MNKHHLPRENAGTQPHSPYISKKPTINNANIKSKIISIATLLCLIVSVNLAITTDVYARKNAHGAQGTGNYKGKRDRHEKPSPQNEKKKKLNTWIPLKQ